jgi:hypothetical protein
MIEPYVSRFAAEGRFVVDRASDSDQVRICECLEPEYAPRIAQALSLIGQLEEAYTSDHEEMLYLALRALDRTKTSI